STVRFPAGTLRKGLLTRAALLMHDTTYSRPIMRGVHARKQFLCETIPMPNPDAVDPADLVVTPPVAGSSTREQVTAKTSAQDCRSCHSLINPIGFAFENYDSVGRFRLNEK